MEEDPATDQWRVTYDFESPAQQIVFLTKRNAFRTGAWTVETPGYAWRSSGGFEVLATSAEPASTVTLRFDSNFAIQPKDYELNLKFSEGSRLLFTGHLAALPCAGEACTRVLDGADTTSFGWQFRTTDDRSVMAGGTRGTTELTLPPMNHETSSYAFFGDLTPTETADLMLVVDPGMPPWMVDQAETAVPKLFRHYAERTGATLDFKPLVFMSYGGAERSGFSNGGGVTGGVVQLAAEGAGWSAKTPGATARWFRFVAHESFHLWNGRLFRTELGPSEEWLSEGSADYFAIRASHELGVTDTAFFQQAIVDAANLCILKLEGAPLSLEHTLGRHGNFYTCGAALLFGLDDRVRRSTEGKHRLDDVFRHMFARARAAGRKDYSTWDLLRTAVELTGDPTIGAEVEHAVHVGLQKDVDRFFQATLRRAGWNVTLSSDVDRVMRPGHFRHALASRLARCDCPHVRSFEIAGGKVTLNGAQDCVALRRPMEVSKVNGIAVADQPGKALLDVLAKANADQPIVLDGPADARVTLRCDPPMHDESFSGLLVLER